MKLDLASGKHPKPGFKTVDVSPLLKPDYVIDLVSGAAWPWARDSIDELHCSHFIEHIPAEEVATYGEVGANVQRGFRQDALFFFFDQAFRVIKPGGVFTVAWPSLKSSAAFQDPTHRRFLPLEFMHYLSRAGREAMGVDHYNVVCNWIVEETKLATAPKPEAIRGSEGGGWLPRDVLLGWDVQFQWEVRLVAEKDIR